MANLIIRVGASMDRSVAATFKSVIDASKAANRTIVAQAQTTARHEQREAQKKVASAERAETAKVRAADKAARDVARAEASKARAAERASQAAVRANEAALVKRERLEAQNATNAARWNDRVAKSFERMEERRTRAAQREADKRERISRAEARTRDKQIERAEKERSTVRNATANMIGSGAARAGSAAFRIGGRVAKEALSVGVDVARGAGVRTDISSHLQERAELETSAVNLSNQGFIAGSAGANGQRQDPKALMSEARTIGNRTATNAGEVMSGLEAFTAKTGDLQTGRALIGDLAVLSKATGTSLQDMADAAGDVSSQLGDIPNKGQAVANVMKAIAGQGKLGAVEIKDMARQMAKVGAASVKFEGAKDANVVLMGAFAQEARQRGGAASATQAATAVQSFSNTFQKGARFDAFKAAGVDVMSKTEKGKFRNPEEILRDALSKTRADPQKLNKMFMDTGAQKVVNGFGDVYRTAFNDTKGTEAEKNAAGIAAYNKEVERLKQAAMGEGEIHDSFKAAMETSSSKAEQFNARMGELAEKLASEALPSLEKLAPQAIALADALTPLVPVVIEVTTALTKFAEAFLGIDTDAAKDHTEIEKAKDTKERIAKGAARGELEKSDINDAHQSVEYMRAMKDRKAKAVDSAGEFTAADAGRIWISGASHFGDFGGAFNENKKTREDRKNAAEAEAREAEIDYKQSVSLLGKIEKHFADGIKIRGANPPPQAPSGPTVRMPMASPPTER